MKPIKGNLKKSLKVNTNPLTNIKLNYEAI